MKKNVLFAFLGLVFLSLVAFSLSSKKIEVSEPISTTAIKWYTLEEAIQANQKSKKKFLIDFYTDWCGWCKVMDKKTFQDPTVIKYLNENFYAVKFNAEQQESISFKGKEYEFMPGGRRGIHRLAYTLLDRQASYPSFVVLNANLDRENIIKGYKTPEPFLSLLGKKGL